MQYKKVRANSVRSEKESNRDGFSQSSKKNKADWKIRRPVQIHLNVRVHRAIMQRFLVSLSTACYAGLHVHALSSTISTLS